MLDHHHRNNGLEITRIIGQSFRIGDDVVLTIVKAEDGRCSIGISAPKSVRVLRGELHTEAAATPRPG